MRTLTMFNLLRNWNLLNREIPRKTRGILFFGVVCYARIKQTVRFSRAVQDFSEQMVWTLNWGFSSSMRMIASSMPLSISSVKPSASSVNSAFSSMIPFLPTPLINTEHSSFTSFTSSEVIMGTNWSSIIEIFY